MLDHIISWLEESKYYFVAMWELPSEYCIKFIGQHTVDYYITISEDGQHMLGTIAEKGEFEPGDEIYVGDLAQGENTKETFLKIMFEIAIHQLNIGG